jgi:hypothetical protein
MKDRASQMYDEGSRCSVLKEIYVTFNASSWKVKWYKSENRKLETLQNLCHCENIKKSSLIHLNILYFIEEVSYINQWL